MLALTMMAAAALVQPSQPQSTARMSFNPNASEPFERDPALRAWALRLHDSNRDGWLTLYEAQPALRSLKQIADADGDGRVTVREFEAAKAFVVARWGSQP